MTKGVKTPAVEAQPWNPEPYQIEAVSFLLDHACGGLFLDPG